MPTHFHKNDFTLHLSLKERQPASWKWSIGHPIPLKYVCSGVSTTITRFEIDWYISSNYLGQHRHQTESSRLQLDHQRQAGIQRTTTPEHLQKQPIILAQFSRATQKPESLFHSENEPYASTRTMQVQCKHKHKDLFFHILFSCFLCDARLFCLCH